MIKIEKVAPSRYTGDPSLEPVAQPSMPNFLKPLLCCRYVIPRDPGYSTQFKQTSVEQYSYPDGKVWQKLFADGKYTDRSMEKKKFPMIKNDKKVKKPAMFEENQTKYIF